MMKIIELINNEQINKDEGLFLFYLLNKIDFISLEELNQVFKKINNIDFYKLKKLNLIIIKKEKIKFNLDQENQKNIEERKKYITLQDVDNIRIIINRELAPFELEKLKTFIKIYSKEEIIDSIYKAMLKNIDNFSYIEKILQNKEKKIEKTNENNKIIRNFDFFE